MDRLRLEHSCRTGQEVADGCGDLIGVRLKREMTGVEKAHRGLRYVTLERLGAGRQKEWIVLSPCRQERWPIGAEVLLKPGIKSDVALVVAKQVKLHFGDARATQIGIIE